MQTTYTLKIQSLLQDAESIVANTNSSELGSFLPLLKNQVDQIQAAPISEIPIIFIGVPDAVEQKQLKQYIGHELTGISSFQATPFELTTPLTIPIRLYNFKNISITQWVKGTEMPGILLIFKEGLSDTQKILELPLLVKRLPFLKIIHAGLPMEVLQKIHQETGAIGHRQWSNLEKIDIVSDLQELSSADCIDKMKAFLTVAEMKSNTCSLLMHRIKEVKENLFIKKQLVKQKEFRVKKLENSFSGNGTSKEMQRIINRRFNQFKTSLEEDLKYQLHPSEGQLKRSLENKLSLLDDLEKDQERKDGKSNTYNIPDRFMEEIGQSLDKFYSKICQENVRFARSYLEIIQRELQTFVKKHHLDVELEIPKKLVEYEMERLIRETTMTRNTFKITGPKKTFIDYVRSIQRPLFLLVMLFSMTTRFVGDFLNQIYQEFQDYIFPSIVAVLGYIIYNIWFKELEEEDNLITNGIIGGKEHLRGQVASKAKTFSSEWKKLLTDGINEVLLHWQEQIKAELEKKGKKGKERLDSEKIKLQLKRDQLVQKEKNITGKFVIAVSNWEKRINAIHAEIDKNLQKLFVSGKQSRLFRK